MNEWNVFNNVIFACIVNIETWLKLVIELFE